MRQALNLIDNWEEEEVVDLYRRRWEEEVRRSVTPI